MRKVVGASIALAAMIAAAASQPGIEKGRRDAVATAGRQETGALAGRLREAGDWLLHHTEERAIVAATLPQVKYQLALLRDQPFEGEVANTLRDFFRGEKDWDVFRQQFALQGISVEGDSVPLLMGASGLAPGALLAKAREAGASSAFLDAGGVPFAVAAARVTVPGRALPPVLLLGKPLDDDTLADLGRRLGLSLVLVDGKVVRARYYGLPTLSAAEATLATAPASDYLGGDRKEDNWAATGRALVGPYVLFALTDARVAAQKAAGGARTARVVVWAAGALIALLALFIGFRTRASAPLAVAAPAPRSFTPRANELAPVVVESTPTPLVPLPRAAAPTRVVEASDDGDPRAGIATSPLRPFGRYILLSQLGEGGMARVYTAVVFGAEGFRRKFVVKRLRPELIEDSAVVTQFIDEAKMASHMVHSNIVPVLDFGKVDDEYFLATEYILGRDLGRLTQRCLDVHRHGLPPDVVLFIAQETLKALEYAHNMTSETGQPRGIVHRDVSPGNVLVSARGEVKLFDFGIVKAEGRATRTQHGVVKGNVSFMSPEQARGLEVDARADLFSLGLVLYTCLAGEILYAGSTSYELLVKAANGPDANDLARIRRLPSPLGAIIEKALAVDPAARFQSASEFLATVTPHVHVGRGGAELAELVLRLFGEDFRQEESGFANLTPPAPPAHLRATSDRRS